MRVYRYTSIDDTNRADDEIMLMWQEVEINATNYGNWIIGMDEDIFLINRFLISMNVFWKSKI